MLLRPGDKFTICDPGSENNLEGKVAKIAGATCRRGRLPAGAVPSARRGAHWDELMLRGRARHTTRPVPGLGNVLLSVASAVVTAIVSQRVLLVENWTVAAHSLGPPMSDLLLETSAWRPHVEREQQAGRAHSHG